MPSNCGNSNHLDDKLIRPFASRGSSRRSLKRASRRSSKVTPTYRASRCATSFTNATRLVRTARFSFKFGTANKISAMRAWGRPEMRAWSASSSARSSVRNWPSTPSALKLSVKCFTTRASSRSASRKAWPSVKAKEASTRASTPSRCWGKMPHRESSARSSCMLWVSSLSSTSRIGRSRTVISEMWWRLIDWNWPVGSRSPWAETRCRTPKAMAR
mmetsp:Transcript_150256/g.482836  ORF Transcript_150256/g.482836 Transcript_150256/m.482836 type:complete len:216 (+) Transcript_150256:1034-1681(+)